MNHKINLQARIKRHSRILKDNLGNTLHNSKKRNFGFWIVAIFLVVLFPIYPAFSNAELYSFDRSEIDESSILSSYDENPLLDLDRETVFETKDSFLSIGSFGEEIEQVREISVNHLVKKGDTIRLIAKKYGVSEETIKWATLIKTDKNLKIGEKIIFPSVKGVFYKVKNGDTVSRIGLKYGISSREIEKFNNLYKSRIRLGQLLVIPGAKYIEEIKEDKKDIKKDIIKKTYSKKKIIKKYQKKKNIKKKYKKSYIGNVKNVKGRFPLKRHRPKSGAPGNCTRYVATYKAVNWRGNANQWLRRAKAKGHKTGSYAKNGSIIVLGGRGYNRRYGHVAIVREVHKDYLIISDMNYRRLYQVTVRKIKRYGSHVRGYIYVN